MSSSKFCTLLKRGMKQDREEKGITVAELGLLFGYKSKSCLHQMTAGTFLPNKEAYEKMCERWPFMSGALDPESLNAYITRKPSTKTTKNKPAMSSTHNGKKHNGTNGKKQNGASHNVMNDFELGSWVTTFSVKTESAMWIEMLETAARRGLALPTVISALKSGLVIHG